MPGWNHGEFLRRLRWIRRRFVSIFAFPKTSQMTRSRTLILGATIVVGTTVAFLALSALRTSIPGRIVRWCLGEPGATQWVNDTADKLVSSAWAAELRELADRLTLEFGSVASTLPHEPFSGGRSIPLDRLPNKYRRLGGIFGDRPDLVLRVSENDIPTALIVSWGHTRQAIVIFVSPPPDAPHGFSVRKVDDRIFVVASFS
jgi:hypothetical protein